MFHYRQSRKRYVGFPKPKGCNFCQLENDPNLLKKTTHHYVVPNRVFYDIWELRRVTDHLLVIPRRHVRSLAELSKAERLDHFAIIADYESQGYNVYARGVASGQRSVEHQHTHLIKAVGKPLRGSLTLRRPYLFITFR